MSNDTPNDRGDPPGNPAASGPSRPLPATPAPDEVHALIRQLAALLPEPGEGVPDSNLTGAGNQGVDEDEVPRSITASVIERGDELDLKRIKEKTTGRLAYLLVGLFAGVAIATIVALFRLPPDITAARLMDLSDKLLVIVVGALGYYFGTKKSGD